MENNVEKALSDFVDEPAEEANVEKIDDINKKKVVLDEREGLIERLDRVFIDKSGRQLLREQY